ncbi:hypothetical protein EC988_003633, partial [Linderina pennispora]
EWLDAEKLTDLEIAGASDKTAAPTSGSQAMDVLPTPVATPAAAAVAASEVDEPELEDTEESERSFIAKNADVKTSILVQKSYAKRSVAVGNTSDEPVSYLRQRAGMVADQPREAVQQQSAPAMDRRQLLDVAAKLLTRINTLYLQKLKEESSNAAVHDHDASAGEEEDDDLAELENELSAMGLDDTPEKEEVASSQQQIMDRLAKLSLAPSQVNA